MCVTMSEFLTRPVNLKIILITPWGAHFLQIRNKCDVSRSLITSEHWIGRRPQALMLGIFCIRCWPLNLTSVRAFVAVRD